jgi:FkbM family methyltransferase
MKELAKAAYRVLPFKPFLFKTLRAFWSPPEAVYRHLHFRAPFELVLPEKTRLRMNHHGNKIENDLFWAGFGNGWEASSLLLWLRLAARSQTILDVGANTGIYALAARAINPRADVIALEPVARTFSRLRDNIQLNAFDIDARCVAASDHNGMATLYDPLSDHQYSASLEAAMLDGKSACAETEIEVRRIETLLAEREQKIPVLVKIDAERHEPQVLEGFGEAITRLRPAFLMELLDRDIGAKARSHFDGLDYVYYEIFEGKGLRRTDELGAAQRNYLFCPLEVAAELGLGNFVEHRSLAVGFQAGTT